MDNKQTTMLGVGIAALTIGLGYLGYTVYNDTTWEKPVNVEKNVDVEKVKVTGGTLEEEAVIKMGKKPDEKMTESLLTRFWKNEFNEGTNVTISDLEN
tara:strand:+ start:11 stop:304 length:294 start_codon:yes stop_codon:yes gene_type:complete